MERLWLCYPLSLTLSERVCVCVLLSGGGCLSKAKKPQEDEGYGE